MENNHIHPDPCIRHACHRLQMMEHLDDCKPQIVKAHASEDPFRCEWILPSLHHRNLFV